MTSSVSDNIFITETRQPDTGYKRPRRKPAEFDKAYVCGFNGCFRSDGRPTTKRTMMERLKGTQDGAAALQREVTKVFREEATANQEAAADVWKRRQDRPI